MAWNGTGSTYSADGRTRTFKPLGSTERVAGRVGAILSVPADELAQTIGTALAAGCGLMFSPTSDGGAVSVIVYVGDVKHKGYATSAGALSEMLADVRDVCEAHMVRPTVGSMKRPVTGS